MDYVRCLRCGNIYEKDRTLCPNCDEALLDASAVSDPSDIQDDDQQEHHRKDERALLAAAAETVMVSAVISHLCEEIHMESSEESRAAAMEIIIDAQEGPADTASNYQTDEVIDGESDDEEAAGVDVLSDDDTVVVPVEEAPGAGGDEEWVVPGDDEADVIAGDDKSGYTAVSDDLQHLQEHECPGSDD